MGAIRGIFFTWWIFCAGFDSADATVGTDCTSDPTLCVATREQCTTNACACAAGYSDDGGGSCVQDCADAPAVTNGNAITYTADPHTSGSTADVTCRSGFTLSASGTGITCTDGAWAAFPTCVLDCLDVQAITNSASITYSGSSTFPHASGVVATVACSAGYTLSGSSTVTCTAGSWGTSPTCDQDCTTDVPPITNSATVSYSGSSIAPHASGVVATVACSAGYTLLGSTTVTCTAGSWGTSPTCDQECANDVTAITDGAIAYSGSSTMPHDAGTEATITCDTGYTPSGNQPLTCTSGSWGTLPTCGKSSGAASLRPSLLAAVAITLVVALKML